MIQCKICLRWFNTLHGLRSHKWRSHTEKGKKHNPNSGRQAWNKGLSKDTDIRVAKNSINSGKALLGRPGKKHTEKVKLSISEKMSGNNNGGRCKWYEVNGVKVQGTWERNFAIELNRRGYKWTKCRKPWRYIMNDKIRHYTPDFYLEEFDLFVEIKGYWWGRDKEKMDCIFSQHSDKRLVVLEKEGYQNFLCGELVW